MRCTLSSQKRKAVNEVTVYDGGDKTFDRYTVILKDGSVIGMSSNPKSPQGFNQYAGERSKLPKNLAHLGRKVKPSILPCQVQEAIWDRIHTEVD